jgi:hypothetical protein
MTRNSHATETGPKPDRNGSKMPPNAATAAAADEPEDNDDMSGFIAENEGAAATMMDDFDSLESFALPQDFDPRVEEEDRPVSCHKPPRDDYFRVHPGPDMTATVGVFEPTEGRGDVYLVKPCMFGLFGNLVSRRQLFVCRTSLGATFLWAAKLPRGDRRSGGDVYNVTALKAAEQAKTRWTRMASDEKLRCYRIFHPKDEDAGQYADPDWSSTPPLLDLLRRTFGDGYVIGDADHPEARRIRGAIK